MGCTYVKEFTFKSGGAVKAPGCDCGGPVKKARGGPITEKATGERYPSREAMVKHESKETPRMQREELVQRSKVIAPARRSVPVAQREPLIMAKCSGGAVKKR